MSFGVAPDCCRWSDCTQTVLTVHDVVHRVAPETMDFRALWATRLFFASSLAKADAIVSNSAGTAERLVASFGYKTAAVVHRACRKYSNPIPRHILIRCSCVMEWSDRTC